MNALAIDTATSALGLCLSTDSGPHPGSRTLILNVGLKHSEKLMPAVHMLLQEAELSPRQLDLIVCSTGPGSFTGIRIGLATAKGLADGVRSIGLHCRLFGVSTLDGLTYRYRGYPGTVVAVNPSLRGKLYAAVYRGGRMEGGYLETTLSALGGALKTAEPMVVTGAAARELYRQLERGEGAESKPVVDDSERSTDPEGLLACATDRLEEPARDPVPLYLRKSEAEINLFGA